MTLRELLVLLEGTEHDGGEGLCFEEALASPSGILTPTGDYLANLAIEEMAWAWFSNEPSDEDAQLLEAEVSLSGVIAALDALRSRIQSVRTERKRA